MKKIVVSMFVTLVAGMKLACAPAESPKAKVTDGIGMIGEYKGIAAIEKVISERVFERSLPLSSYVEVSYSGSLRELLGVYLTENGVQSFKNGTPNSINLLLWNIVMRGIAKDVAAISCEPPATPTPTPTATPTPDPGGGIRFPYPGDSERYALLLPYFKERSKKLCDWPASSARSGETLLNLWLALISYDAPQREFLAWRETLLGEKYAAASGEDVLKDAVYMALMNPHFLLRK